MKNLTPRTVTLIIALAASTARASQAAAQGAAAVNAATMPGGGGLGLGIELGEQNGVSGKYLFDRNQGIDAGLGASDGNVSFHAGYIRQAFDLLPQPKQGRLDVHAGLGFRQRSNQFGIRPVAGIGYWIENHPAEIFFDLGPIFRLSPNAGTDFTAVLGVRFYFKPGRR